MAKDQEQSASGHDRGRVKIVRVEEVVEKHRGHPPPSVDPKVDPERAVRALEQWPGGKEVIEQLRQEGLKI